MSNYITEAFKEFNLLTEAEDFTLDNNSLEEFTSFLDMAGEDVPDVEVYDLEAESEEELKDSYIGKIILDCNVCHSKIFYDRENLELDEEGNVNIEDECPYCLSTDGYTIIGQISPFKEGVEFEEPEVGEPVETEIEIDTDKDGEEDIEIEVEGEEEDKEKNESLKEAYVGDILIPYEDIINKYKNSPNDLISGIIDKALYIVYRYLNDGDMCGAAEVDDRGHYIPWNKPLWDTACSLGGTLCGLDDNVERSFDALFEYEDTDYKSGYERLLKDFVSKVFNEEFLSSLSESLEEGISLKPVDRLKRSDRIKGQKELKGVDKLDGNKEIKGERPLDEAVYSISMPDDIMFSKGINYEVFSDEDGHIANVTSEYEAQKTISELQREDRKLGRSGINYDYRELDKPISDFNNEAAREWLYDHEQALEDIENHYGKNIESLTMTDIEDWFSEHDQAYEDVIRYSMGMNEALDREGREIPQPSNTAEVVYDRNGVKIFFVTDVKDMIQLGDGTEWAIAGRYGGDGVNVRQAQNYFNAYKDDMGINGYYVIIDGNEKYGVLSNGKEVKAFGKDGRQIYGSDIIRKYPVLSQMNESLNEASEIVDEVIVDKNEDGFIGKMQELRKAGYKSCGCGDGKIRFCLYKPLDESIESASIETDNETLTMTTNAEGGVVVETTPKDELDSFEGGAEMIEPLDDMEQDEILDNASKELEDEEDIYVPEEEFPYDEFDEESFNSLGESYLKRCYENVSGFKTTSVTVSGGKFFIEGMIDFTSGNQKKTNFTFESVDTKDNKVKLVGLNEQIAKGKKSFKLGCSIVDNKLVCESLNYNYRSKNELNESVKVYGTIRNKK